MNVFGFNRRAKDRLFESSNRWTVAASKEDIAKVRDGDWWLVLTPSLLVPISCIHRLQVAASFASHQAGGGSGVQS